MKGNGADLAMPASWKGAVLLGASDVAVRASQMVGGAAITTVTSLTYRGVKIGSPVGAALVTI